MPGWSAPMSTNKETIAGILGDLAPLAVRARAMFGEYGIYCDEWPGGIDFGAANGISSADGDGDGWGNVFA